MPKQPPIRVALDLETTGLHAEQDAILEVAAVKFQGATILDTMETLVAPGRPIPFRVQRLTGIMPQLVADAPSFESISRRFQKVSLVHTSFSARHFFYWLFFSPQPPVHTNQ